MPELKPPGFDQAIAEAGDLDHVCSPRRLQTSEIFAPNAFYGNDWLLKLYAGLPSARALKIVVPHSVVLDESYVWRMERRAPLPAVLAYNDERAQAYARATGKLPIRSAVPFAYLPSLLAEAAPRERSGTLFFPGHSSDRMTASANFAGLAARLAALDARYQPVSVCLYWRDRELGRHLPFLERGLRVVSAGHMLDPAFLFRLYHLCRAHRYAASNHVGSSLLYSVMAGCSFFVLQGFGVAYTGARAHGDEDLSAGGAALRALAQAFAAPVDEVTASQRALVASLCGLRHRLDPAELRDVLAMADRLDRLGLARHPRTRRLHAAVPRTWLRAAASLALAARRRVGGLVRNLRPS